MFLQITLTILVLSSIFLWIIAFSLKSTLEDQINSEEYHYRINKRNIESLINRKLEKSDVEVCKKCGVVFSGKGSKVERFEGSEKIATDHYCSKHTKRYDKEIIVDWQNNPIYLKDGKKINK